MRLEVDPVRLRALRNRLRLPVEAAAKRSGVDAETIERLEAERTAIELSVLRRLAKAYNRNWYVFLLDEEEPGTPALPRDFRTLAKGRELTAATLTAFDDAAFLIDKIVDLPRAGRRSSTTLPAIAGMDSETAAKRVREALNVTLEVQQANASEYDALRMWSSAVAQTGIYAAQLSFPYREVRAFCLLDRGVSLVVTSSQDSARARVFSLLHELAHLLRGTDGMCRPRSDEPRASTVSEEAYCNAFAGALLMPAAAFMSDPLARALRNRALELGEAVPLARRYGVSELAALRRLATLGLIAETTYERLHGERDAEFSDEPQETDAPRIRKQPIRMINENSRLYASEVLDAHARGDITLREIGVLLGGNLKHVPAIREELAR